VWVNTTNIEGPRNTTVIKNFASISYISQAFRLNFMQHHAYEYFARLCLQKWAIDIDDSYSKVACDLPSQVVGVLVGAAGTGKSEVIAALLAFSVSWGRRDTIETVASQNCAALNVDGETIHTSRGMNLFLESKRDSSMQDKVKKLVLIIKDEFSMIPQPLAGASDRLTREILHNSKPVGGLHILLMGDPLQLPPVAANSMYDEPNDKTQTSNATAGFQLWLAINWKSVLIEIWRQRHDKQFIGILDRAHYGVLTLQDKEALLSQHVSHVLVKQPLVFTSTDYFSPMATALNSSRCDFIKTCILEYCGKYGETIYQIMAETSTQQYASTVKRFSYLNDDFTSKIPLLLSFHIGMNVMVTQKIPELKNARVCTKGTMGTIVGVVMGEEETDDQFDIFFVTERRIKVKRYKKLPHLILIQIRGCKRQLVTGYPVGVIGIPYWHGSCKIDLPGKRSISPTLSQFPIISTYAMTPEKLQGITLENYLFVSILDRSGFAPQTFYVTLSRVAALICLIITEYFDMDYLEQFRPPTTELLIMKDILENFVPPAYIPPVELERFKFWQAEQLSYCLDALQRNSTKLKQPLKASKGNSGSLSSGASKAAKLLAEASERACATAAAAAQEQANRDAAAAIEAATQAATTAATKQQSDKDALASSTFNHTKVYGVSNESIGIIRKLPRSIHRYLHLY